MVDIVNTEAISKAVVQERLGAAPALGSTEAVAAEMIGRADQGNWREALQFGSEITVSRSDVFGRVDQIGAERDADGKRTRAEGSDELKRFNRASKAAELALKFEQKGYQGLSPTEKSTAREKVKNTILQNPSIAREFIALNATDQTAFLERILGNNAYSVEIRRALVGFSEAGGVDDSASEKQMVLEQRKTEQEVRQSELDDVQRRLGTTKTRIDSFDDTKTTHAKLDQLNNARTTLSEKASNLAAAEEEERKADAALKGKQEARGATIRGNAQYVEGVDTTEERVALAGASSKVARLRTEAELARNAVSSLELEQQGLEEQRQSLSAEESEKKIAKGEADINLARAQRDLRDALSLRQRQEENIVTSLDGVFSTAAKELIDKQIEAYGNNFEESLKKINTEGMTADEKALITALETRWVRVIPRRRFGGRTQPRRVIDQARVNNDFSLLMASGDEAYVKQVLSETINPATNTNYSGAEVDALIANKDFIDKMKPKVLTQLVARKVVIGGIEPSDAYQITQSEWGKNAIAEAMAANDNFNAQVEALLGKGALDRPDFMERLRREAENRPGLLAALIAALAAAGGVVVGAGALGVAALGAAGGGAVLTGARYSRGNRIYG